MSSHVCLFHLFLEGQFIQFLDRRVLNLKEKLKGELREWRIKGKVGPISIIYDPGIKSLFKINLFFFLLFWFLLLVLFFFSLVLVWFFHSLFVLPFARFMFINFILNEIEIRKLDYSSFLIFKYMPAWIHYSHLLLLQTAIHTYKRFSVCVAWWEEICILFTK